MTAARSPHRAWVEIDHVAIRFNLAALRARAPGSDVIAVVKANAYGHGDVAVARTLVAAGVERLAVATVDEGLRLRDAGIAAPIIVLWGIGPAEASVVVQDEQRIARARGAEAGARSRHVRVFFLPGHLRRGRRRSRRTAGGWRRGPPGAALMTDAATLFAIRESP
jgi:hypothetical protein